MSEEKNSNTEMFAAGSSTVDDTRGKLSEDAASLGPMRAGSIVIGLVDEIVGDGGLEVPGCVATQYEWIQIVKHRAAEMIALDFDYFLYGSTGSTEWRIREYAHRRLNTIAKAIGEEEVKKAFKQAEQEFANGVDQRAWKVFKEGTSQERLAFQDEIAREMSGIEDPQVVARIIELMKSLDLDCLVTGRKAVRFAILSTTAAAAIDPACIVVPVVEYLNADPNDGRYTKNTDGSVPPIHWEIRFVGLSRIEMIHIQRLPDAGQAADAVDVVMLRSDPASGREFSRASNTARWRKNPELVAEVEKVSVEASNAFAAKVAGRNGMTLYDNFQAASEAIRNR